MPRSAPRIPIVRGLYVICLVLTASVAFVSLALSGATGFGHSDILPTAILSIIGIATESNSGRFPVGLTISSTTIVMTTALLLSGITGALIVGLCSTALLITPDAFFPRLFNSATVALCAISGGCVYFLVGGVDRVDSANEPRALLLHSLIPLVCAIVTISVVNIVCVAAIITLAGGTRLGTAVADTASASWSVYPGCAVVAFVFAVLWGPAGLGVISILPILTPLLLAQWSVSVRAQESEAHLRTVETLVAAGQASQSVLRGRSAWVEAVSREIGIEAHLSVSSMQSLQYAALLHDIGLVAPAGRSPGNELTDQELVWITSHPHQGVRMLQGIEFLSEALVAVEHHHERWDGRGYPSGLAAYGIPALARTLTIADAFCALVAADPALSADRLTTLSEHSLDAVRKLQGLQFDPEGVDALARALPRVIEALTRLIAREAPLPVTGVDPHLPWVSEMFAAS